MNRAVFLSQCVLRQKKMSDVAKAAGISRSTLYRKIKGESEFTKYEMVRISHVLGWTHEQMIEYFFDKKCPKRHKEKGKYHESDQGI